MNTSLSIDTDARLMGRLNLQVILAESIRCQLRLYCLLRSILIIAFFSCPISSTCLASEDPKTRKGARVEPQMGVFDARRAAFDPTSPTRLLVVEGDGRVGLWSWPLDSRAPLRRLVTINKQDVTSACFTLDGSAVLTASLDGRLCRWDFHGRKVWCSDLKDVLSGEKATIFAARGMVVAVGVERNVVFFDLSSGRKEARSLKVARAGVHALAVSHSRNRLASIGLDGTVRIWRIGGGDHGRALTKSFGKRVSAAEFIQSNNQETLATVDEDNFLRVWRIDGGSTEELWQREIEGGSIGTMAAMSTASETLVAIASRDGAIRILEAEGLEPVAEIQGGPGILSLSGSGSFLLSVNGNGVVNRRNLEKSYGNTEINGSHKRIRAVRFSPRGGWLASASEEGFVEYWNVDGHPRAPFGFHENGVQSVVFSPTGSFIASAGLGGRIRLRDLDIDGNEDIIFDHGGDVLSLAFSPKGDVIASGGGDGMIRLWRTDGTQIGRTLDGNEEKWGGRSIVQSIAFSRTGEELASAAASGHVVLWDWEQGVGESLFEHEDGAEAVAFSPVDDRLLSGGGDGVVRLWDYKRKVLIRNIDERNARVRAVDFSPSGSGFATAHDDDSVRLWNHDGTALGHPLWGHRNLIAAISYSPSGDYLASADTQGVIQLWDVSGKGYDSEELIAHDSIGRLMAISTQGDLVLLGSSGYVLVCNLRQDSCREFSQDQLAGARALTAAPDGELIIINMDGSLRCVDFEGRSCHVPANMKRSGFSAIAVSPSGDAIAVGDEAGDVQIFERNDGSVPIELFRENSSMGDSAEGSGSDPWITSIAWSRRDKRIAVADSSGRIRLSSIDGKESSVTLRGELVVFSESGKLLAAARGGDHVEVRKSNSLTDLYYQARFVDISSIGFMNEVLWVYSSSGRIVFVDMEKRREMVWGVFGEGGGLLSAWGGWYTGAGSLKEESLLFFEDYSESPIRLSASASKRYYRPGRVIAQARGGWDWTVLVDQLTNIRDGITPIGVLLALPACYVVAIAIVFLIWLFQPARLAKWAMSPGNGLRGSRVAIVVETLILIRAFGSTGWAVSAWFDKNRDVLRETLMRDAGKKVTSQEYIEAGRGHRPKDWANPPSPIWISGPGSCGKSALAFCLACSRGDDTLPIFVKGDWGDAILNRLEKMLRVDGCGPNKRMISVLAKKDSFVVIIDGFSEYFSPRIVREEKEEMVYDFWRQESFRRVVVTSRSEPIRKDRFEVMRVGMLAGRDLRDFVENCRLPATDRLRFERDVEGFAGGGKVPSSFLCHGVGEFWKNRRMPTLEGLVASYVPEVCGKAWRVLNKADFDRAVSIAVDAFRGNIELGHSLKEVDLRDVFIDKGLVGGDAQACEPSVVVEQFIHAGLVRRVDNVDLEFNTEPVVKQFLEQRIQRGREISYFLQGRILRIRNVRL